MHLGNTMTTKPPPKLLYLDLGLYERNGSIP